MRELHRLYMRQVIRLIPWIGLVFVITVAAYLGLAAVGDDDTATLTTIFEVAVPLLAVVVLVLLALGSRRRSNT